MSEQVRTLRAKASDLRVAVAVMQSNKTRDQPYSLRQRKLLNEAAALDARADLLEQSHG